MKTANLSSLLLLLLVAAATSCTSTGADSQGGPGSRSAALSASWSVVPSPNTGGGDNVLTSVAGTAPNDVWAVGQYIPNDTANVTRTLANHYDGSAWTIVATPNVGNHANALAGVTVQGAAAWAVGYYLDGSWASRSLIEAWDGANWTVVTHPQVGAADHLHAIASLSASDIWAAGWSRDDSGTFSTLVMHFDGASWSTVPTPNPGVLGNLLYAIVAPSPRDVWVVGQQVGATGPDRGLVLHWNGHAFAEVASPGNSTSSAELLGVASGSDGAVHAIGDGEDFKTGTKVFAEVDASGTWVREAAPSPGPLDNRMEGITVLSDNTALAVGEVLDAASGNDFTLIEANTGDGWHVLPSPSPNPDGENLLASVTQIGHDVWAVGAFDGENALQTLILRRAE